ncbi:response regulator transcription factor [Clostridium sp.]|uniref:response regulator transcription factor n=1 Tax=Clostridium sp. TaxID=1506 RepID=UPI002914DBE4|nr:response regulator transcription factor [Clostridium sp.]MDU5105174.1 response regulator transcription factor [Clostridium sp.]
MQRILIVEDEEAISNLIKINLIAEGYMCKCAFNGIDAANIIEDEKFDLILLDIMLPGIDGYELLEYIKPLKTPVIFITAMGTVENRIKGLKLGADDYIVKPFQIGELLARIEAVLRRVKGGDKVYEILGVKINQDSRSVIKNGKYIDLTVKEFDLLLELIKNKNIALYRNQLYERVWQEEFMGDTRTIDLHIQRLRKKLGWENNIKTVFRIGYRLEV